MLHKDQEKDPFLLGGRLNHDPLENLFSLYRQRGGYNRIPTVQTFNVTFKIQTVIALIKPPDNANCKPDKEVFLADENYNITSQCMDEVDKENGDDSSFLIVADSFFIILDRTGSK